MVNRSNSERTSTATVDRGLYILRYASSGSQADAPLVHIRPSFGSEAMVRLVPGPGASATSLTRPGSALVVVAEGRASIQITVQAIGDGAPVAEIKIEAVEGSVSSEAAPSKHEAHAPLAAKAEGFELIAHVARRGDLSVPAGRWIAGPEGPAPIEGVGVLWPTKGNRGLEYQVHVQGEPGWSEWTVAGRFAGTRGYARPLVGVRFRLTDELNGYILKGSALFLGSAAMERSGSTIEFRSAAGFDPLVGLRLEVSAAEAAVPKMASLELGSPQPQSERRGRVRVFRAGVEQK